MKAHVEISRETNPILAGTQVARATRERLGRANVDLAFVFFSPHFAETAQELIKTIHQELSPRVLLGCMGEGVIGQTEEFEETPVVSLWAAELPDVPLVPFHLTFEEEGERTTISGWPKELLSLPPQPTFIVLADPFSAPVEELFAKMDECCPMAKAVGGIASGGTDLGENRLVLHDQVYYGGIVGVGISGEILIQTVVSQGCRPIGDRYVVTKAERNIIYELGGVPTLERLQSTIDALGSEGGRKAAMALQLGVAFDEHQKRFDRGDFLIRGLIGADQNSGGVAVSDIVKEGQTVQFHFRDAGAASEELNLLLAQERVNSPEHKPRAALLFTCNGRGRKFFGQANHDIEAVLTRVGDIPIAGFFAAGEIGPVGGQNFIHGYTASVALFG